MIIAEREKELMNEIQRKLRKEDTILIRHLSEDLTKNEELLLKELQNSIRRIDKILNYVINNHAFSEQQKDKIVKYLLENDIIDYLISDKQQTAKKEISYKELLNSPEPITPVPATNDKLTSILLSEENLESLISSLLLEIGIPARLNGYNFIRTALILLLENNKLERIYVTKDLYPEIAKKYKTTSTSVERCIRHAIEMAWKRGNLEVLDKLFGYSISEDKGKTTNAEFLFLIADYIRLHR